MPYHGFFVLLYSDWGNPFQDIREKKKRYAYLVLENVGNFQIEYKDSIVVLTLWRGLLLLHPYPRFPTTFK